MDHSFGCAFTRQSRSKPTLARYRLSGSPLPGTSREALEAAGPLEDPRNRPENGSVPDGIEPVLPLSNGADWLYHVVITRQRSHCNAV